MSIFLSVGACFWGDKLASRSASSQHTPATNDSPNDSFSGGLPCQRCFTYGAPPIHAVN